MQIDDTLILVDQSFVVVEEKAIISAKIMTKTREQLTSTNLLKFNDTQIERIDTNDNHLFQTTNVHSRHTIDQFNRINYHH
jgi:hypothetical protein